MAAVLVEDAGGPFVDADRHRERDEEREVDAENRGEEVGCGGVGADGFRGFRMHADDRGGARGHHRGAADAGAHGERMRVEDAELGDDAGEDRDPEGAEDGAADVHAHHAAAFGARETEAFRDDRDVRFTVDRVAGADRFAAHADQDRHRQTEDERAEEVAEFLHEEREPRVHDHLDVRTDVEADLGDEDQHADAEHLRGALHFGELQDLQPRVAHDRPDDEGVEERHHHDETQPDHADHFRNHADD